MAVGALLLVTSGATTPPETVRIEGLACGSALIGTGFLVDDVVVTNAHVVAGASELAVVDEAGNESAAVVVAFDPAADLAALRTSGDDAALRTSGDDGESRAVTFAEADPGDRGFVAGQTFEVKRRVRAHISDIYGDQQVVRLSLEIEADIARGDSGAPLVDAEGAVVGVIYASSRGKENTAYAIRSLEVQDFVASVSDAPPTGGRCR